MKKEITLRCSSLPSLMTCAPSVLNPEGWTQVDNYVESAELGTALHDLCQRIVEKGEYDLTEIKARFPAEAGRAEQIITNFYDVWQVASSTVIQNPTCELYHEANLVDQDDLSIKLTGHIDLCQLENDKSYILDYKTGRSHENHYDQVAGYGYLLWDFAGRPDTFTVYIAVVYLEDNTTQNYTLSAGDLKKWRRDVEAKVRDPRYVVSRKCGVCSLNASCPSHLEDLSYTFTFLTGARAQRGAVSWKSLDPEERGKLIDKLYVARKGMQRVEVSLKAAMQGKRTDTDRLDIGKGMVYEKVTTTRRSVVGPKAIAALRKRFDQRHIDEIVKFDLNAILDLAARFAPRGKKAEARQEMLDLLIETGGVEVESSDRFQRRPADEKVLTKEENV